MRPTPSVPRGLSAGATYYFRVRAANGPSSSAYSATATATAPGGAAVRVASYNLLCAGGDGTKVGDGVVAPWGQRRLAAAKLVDRVQPDVIAVQEGASGVGQRRQVDSFVAALNALGNDYLVADIESAKATGPYIVYRSGVWAPVGTGGRYELGNGRYAAYQVLQHRTSGARVLVTSAHLTPGKASTDAKRKAEAAKLDLPRRRDVAVLRRARDLRRRLQLEHGQQPQGGRAAGRVHRPRHA